MATEVIRSCSGINFESTNYNTFGMTNFSQPYPYFDETFPGGEVVSKEVEFEDEKPHGMKHKNKTYLLFDKKEDFKVPIDILNRAEQISQQMDRAIHNRKGRRKRRQFACIYFAYDELSVDVYSPQGIADIVGLPHEEISPAITDFSPLRSGYKPAKRNVVTIHPSARIAADYAKDLDFTHDEIEHTKMIIIDAIKADPKIKARKPGTIAIGGIAGCIFLRNKPIGFDALYDVSKISASTIKQTRDQILTAYNS